MKRWPACGRTFELGHLGHLRTREQFELYALKWPSRRTWLVNCALLTGAGCATRTPVVPVTATLSGRISLQISPQGSEPARQWGAGFELRGSAHTGELDLTSPLGTLVAQARWQPGLVELAQGGERRRFADLDDLALQLLGEAVPLQALFEWLRGRPWAGAPHEQTEGGFSQAGWSVDLTGMTSGTLTARRVRAPAITLRARLESTP